MLPQDRPLWRFGDGPSAAQLLEALEGATSATLHLEGRWSLGAHDVLRDFARRCALEVIDRWPAPALVVRYLQTGDPELRAEAREAASYVLRHGWNDKSGLHSPEAARAAVRAAYGPLSTATPFSAALVVLKKARRARPASRALEVQQAQERLLGDLLVEAAIDRKLAPDTLRFCRELLRAAKLELGLAQLARLSEEERSQALIWADAIQCGQDAPRPSFLDPEPKAS